jgi:DNA-binding NtrC family response regulator
LVASGDVVLVVDDDPALLTLTAECLRQIGYTVETFSTTTAARSRFEEDPKRFRLVIADATMPGESGVEMVKAMLERKAGMRAIVWSGFPVDDQGLAEKSSQVRVLLKPVSPGTLGVVASSLLREATPTTRLPR